MIINNEYIQFSKLDKNTVAHLYTKKPFDFNGKKIDKSILLSEYEKIQDILNYKCKKIIKPNQIHSNIVKIVDNNNINDKFENVDGLITNIKGVALVTSLADCQGILLYDKRKNVIGNIHSGWKGTLNGIVSNAIKLMQCKYNCDIRDIEVYICPSILKCCFEVDEDVKEQFVANFSNIPINQYVYKGKMKDDKQKYFVDTVGININVLKKYGILEKNIYDSNICTKCNNREFHSHRGDSLVDGRNIAFIVLK